MAGRMAIARLAVAAAAMWSVAAGACAHADDKPAPKKVAKVDFPNGLPMSLAGFSDSGKFSIYQRETRIIAVDFTWTQDGKYESKSTLSFGGQKVEFWTKITPDEKGIWKSVAIKGQSGEGSMERDGAKAIFKNGARSQEVKLWKNAALFDNFGPALATTIVRAYDRSRGGKQQVPIVIAAAAMTAADVSFIDSIERAVNGKDIKFDRYVVHLGNVEITFWADKTGRIYLGEVPAQKAYYVRDGYEALMQQPDVEKGQLSKPIHEVQVRSNVKVPMRDGIDLATDLYMPTKPGKYPVVLIRTPYKKEVSELEGRYFARRGYVAAIQDVRGRFSSPGAWEPFVNEADDGYDAIEWLAAQPWSTGKLGMIGASYLGWVQWQALSRNPPHLTCLIPNVAPPDPFFNFPYEYGVFFLWGGIWWADIVEQKATADVSGATLRKLMQRDLTKELNVLPVVDIDKKFFGKENSYWRKWLDHSTNDAYWARASFANRLAKARVPVFHQSGWFDGDGIGSKLNYAAMARHGHPHQKLVLGPWGHTDTANRYQGDIDFGPEAQIDLQREYLRWFDCWLKGMDNGVQSEPLVRLFAMNSNQWHVGNKYPLEQTRFEKWYLSSKGRANTSKGDGALTRAAPTATNQFDAYAYDPGDPTPRPELPGIAQPAKDGAKAEDAKKSAAKANDEKSAADKAAHVRRVMESRQDILVYATEPFKEPYTFAGPIEAVIYASSSAKDTDWFVRLVEIDAKGTPTTLVEGKIRARFRESMAKPKLLEPGKVYEYRIDCWQTGITMQKGSRLRVEVASASFPLFSRNLNTGGHNEKDTAYVKAQQRIHHDAEHPSHIVLPALPATRSP